MCRRVAVLGSTGSIGCQALEVIEKSQQLTLHSIVCGSSLDKLNKQTDRYSPAYSACTSSGDENDILARAMDGADIVLNAIVGSAGLKASLLVQEMNIPLALANKESLVIGSDLLKSSCLPTWSFLLTASTAQSSGASRGRPEVLEELHLQLQADLSEIHQ